MFGAVSTWKGRGFGAMLLQPTHLGKSPHVVCVAAEPRVHGKEQGGQQACSPLRPSVQRYLGGQVWEGLGE